MSCNAKSAPACRIAMCALTTSKANTQLFRTLRTQIREVRAKIAAESIAAPTAAPNTFSGTVNLAGFDPIPIIAQTRTCNVVTLVIRFQLLEAIDRFVANTTTLGTLGLEFQPSADLPGVQIFNSGTFGPTFPTSDVRVLADGSVLMDTPSTFMGDTYAVGQQFNMTISYDV